ncbi:hypothetical protein GRF63_06240 [Erythrobacter sp. GH3-10]|uniref:Uncharacterized protein n=2 Tax=Aurantiacibacter rhizosphaerae TaxID=2691582 RepID=A0A844XCE4_9SPHN|nr:hypothetical protein [Aurantiacibacter rhizosphaerae]
MAFIFVMLLVCLIFGTIAGKRDRAHKIQKLELEARIEEAKAAQVSRGDQTQADLEDRMRVLERIVTDPGADLSRQIEDLRAETEARKEAAS